jgi:uncharacterized RDD family membrane protein YckC
MIAGTCGTGLTWACYLFSGLLLALTCYFGHVIFSALFPVAFSVDLFCFQAGPGPVLF